jgi:hypothetical protein
MFVKSKLILAPAMRNRDYTDKTHLRGFQELDFPCFPKEVDFACVVANYIRPKLLKYPLNNLSRANTRNLRLFSTYTQKMKI